MYVRDYDGKTSRMESASSIGLHEVQVSGGHNEPYREKGVLLGGKICAIQLGMQPSIRVKACQ